MNPRTYLIRVLLIMTVILVFATAPGPIYAGDLADCVMILEDARDCFEGDTTTLRSVQIIRLARNRMICQIIKNPNAATIELFQTFTDVFMDPLAQSRECQIIIVNTDSCDRNTRIIDLTRTDYAAWGTLVRAECRAAM